MSDTIAKFNVQLLTSMKALQNRMEALNARGVADFESAEKEIRSQIAALESRGKSAKDSLETARADVMKWADDSTATVASWKAKFDAHRLSERADRASRYAEAASQVAIASVEQAERATLDAKLAHAEAASAKASKAA
jgi:hypothetical protein